MDMYACISIHSILMYMISYLSALNIVFCLTSHAAMPNTRTIGKKQFDENSKEEEKKKKERRRQELIDEAQLLLR